MICDKCVYQKACTNIFASLGVTGDAVTECGQYENIGKHEREILDKYIEAYSQTKPSVLIQINNKWYNIKIAPEKMTEEEWPWDDSNNGN